MARTDLTAARLRELLHYDPETGVFTWRVRVSQAVKAGAIAGRINYEGYATIKVLGHEYRAHRLALFYMEGKMPAAEVDHINGVRLDNRLVNLRHADRATNAQNMRKALRTNLSCGLIGATWDRRREVWKAAIQVNGKKRMLGAFNTAEEAHARYLEEKRACHPGCTI